MNNLLTYPIELVNEFLSNRKEIREVEFGIYTYIPRGLDNPRRIRKVNANELLCGYEILCREISDTEEIAFHSRVYIGTAETIEVQHIPLIDLKGKNTDRIGELTDEVLNEYGWEKAFLFDSGRSYHLYFQALLSHNAWHQFMGRILLFNIEEEPELVDSRWVGYSLRAGYGALRWTKNTPWSLSRPKNSRIYSWKQRDTPVKTSY